MKANIINMRAFYRGPGKKKYILYRASSNSRVPSNIRGTRRREGGEGG